MTTASSISYKSIALAVLATFLLNGFVVFSGNAYLGLLLATFPPICYWLLSYRPSYVLDRNKYRREAFLTAVVVISIGTVANLVRGASMFENIAFAFWFSIQYVVYSLSLGRFTYLLRSGTLKDPIVSEHDLMYGTINATRIANTALICLTIGLLANSLSPIFDVQRYVMSSYLPGIVYGSMAIASTAGVQNNRRAYVVDIVLSTLLVNLVWMIFQSDVPSWLLPVDAIVTGLIMGVIGHNVFRRQAENKKRQTEANTQTSVVDLDTSNDLNADET